MPLACGFTDPILAICSAQAFSKLHLYCNYNVNELACLLDYKVNYLNDMF